MTMHLEGPWLSTTGRRKGQQKFRNANEARKAKANKESWAELQKKWGCETEKKKKRSVTKEVYYSPPEIFRRDTGPKIPSKITHWDPCVKPAEKVYTGTKMLGIGTMHKSNSVPIFSSEEAVEISKMRR